MTDPVSPTSGASVLDTQSLLNMAQSALEEMSSAPAKQVELPVVPPQAEPVAAPPRSPIEQLVLDRLAEFDIKGIGGNLELPANLQALEKLLTNPLPNSDFTVLDTLYECWPKDTVSCGSAALLAVALNIGRTFGEMNKLPLSMSRSWRMLHAGKFGNVFAWRLRRCGQFIREWQDTQGTFIILDFGEIEMIEGLFEALSPSQHMDVLIEVMNFKVLSNRRMGLLRRVPNRVKKAIAPHLPTNWETALREMAHYKALLDRLATPPGFPPIIEAAALMSTELEKMMQAVAANGAPPPPPTEGGGLALGRIG